MHTRELSPADMAMRNIVRQIGVGMPEGFSGDKYWAMTVETHDLFVDAVSACREEDTKANRDAVRLTGAEWRKAWRRAYKSFRDDRGA